jgi:hypothetical protein
MNRDFAISIESVTEQHLAALVEILSDLVDAEVMRGAWS